LCLHVDCDINGLCSKLTILHIKTNLSSSIHVLYGPIPCWSLLEIWTFLDEHKFGFISVFCLPFGFSKLHFDRSHLKWIFVQTKIWDFSNTKQTKHTTITNYTWKVASIMHGQSKMALIYNFGMNTSDNESTFFEREPKYLLGGIKHSIFFWIGFG
jgi:hypothetical protein